ncbi:MAG TPA: LysE family transporter [Chlamydiales bacterium]|nr:LysE family transporter [Chlamydiales bacterium]
MDLLFFIKGIILGFCLAAPVGPIGILCIRKTMQFGRLAGLFSGLGAALADTFYGVISAFGLTLVSDFLVAGRFWLHLIGGFFLLFLGGKTFLAKPADNSEQVTHKTLIKDLVSTFFLTLANPLTLLAFVAAFAGLGLAQNQSSAPSLVLGVFIGSSFWWLILSEGVTYFRKKMSDRAMIWINRTAGVILMCLGLAAVSLIAILG